MSDFDAIIKALDDRLAPPVEVVPEPVQPRPEPPQFQPGDLVKVIETRFPPGPDGEVMKTTGLYDRPGFPKFDGFINEDTVENQLEARKRRLENCIGHVKIDDTCLVLAVWFCEDDAKWYYFLNNTKPKGRGWTRCNFRLERLKDGDEKRQR
jgi:hypothetical protein